MSTPGVFSIGLLLFTGATYLYAAEPISTPFGLVPLWSEEMLSHLTGRMQPACSGPNAGTCERRNAGLCDGTTYLGLSSHDAELPPGASHRMPAKQSNSANPQFFKMLIENAEYSYANDVHRIARDDFKTIDLLFDCQISGNDDCVTSRFHLGAVHALEIGIASSGKTIDLTRLATVLPEGKIVVPVDRALRDSLFADTRAVNKVRAVVDCFIVRPSPVEWTFPVREAPSPNAPALGTIIARLTPEMRIRFVYRPNEGQDMPFETDWVDEDWGYDYLREQTILDRKGDWFLLPPRPFPRSVWIHLTGRAEHSSVSAGTIYVLSKSVDARVPGTSRTVTIAAGNVIVIEVHGRTLEIRKEEDFDGPCADSDARAAGNRLPTFLVDAEQFYDSNLHLLLKPAYTRGC